MACPADDFHMEYSKDDFHMEFPEDDFQPESFQDQLDRAINTVANTFTSSLTRSGLIGGGKEKARHKATPVRYCIKLSYAHIKTHMFNARSVLNVQLFVIC